MTTQTKPAGTPVRPQAGPPALSAALLPGLAVCVLATAVAMIANHFLPAVSPLLIAIILGAVMANVVHLPQRLQPGLQFSAKRLLRAGVALLGLQLMFSQILGLGWGVIVMVVAIVGLGITGSMFIGKLLGLSWTQRILIACGFSICGAAAAAAVDGVVQAEEEEVVTAVALVIIFGTLMIPIIPALSDLFGFGSKQAGLWAGGSVHEVAQVVATAGAIGGGALAVAVVVKLARVLMLAPVMAVLSLRQRRSAEGLPAGSKRPPIIPLFVAMFIAMVALRSTGVLPDAVLGAGKFVETALLTAAMFALGAGVQVATMRKVGAKPFVMALLSTVWVMSIALVGVLLVG
ncbi:putative sulfate exporter family transporter [Rhodococcus sp. D2-41]|uniref:Sulfate exporter family transporter n=1 Tax=Speluncibacter jeojiensis TaxID=2710754 RepID=A0A9X4LX95_9ACTN|nr:putative sulfate exporter family transporter [Rhodococcus sp. D2-41]MDG3010349.1 putative sulfate exporter family transporter [Rhodococcus sp. D2-41]MDG3014083.1 putative sulfate exporter family transporter [Corynebacteriales bacterium D3-21]